MYISKGDHVRVFTNSLPKDMIEGRVVSVTDDMIHIDSVDGAKDIFWKDVDAVFPCPHSNPDHMFDQYSLEKGDKIKLTYYTIGGDLREAIGTVVNIVKSVIILCCDSSIRLIAPFNIQNIILLAYVTRKPKSIVS